MPETFIPQLAPEAPNVMAMFRDQFEEELTRSRATKLQLAELVPSALENLIEILAEPFTDKNRATKADVARWVIDRQIITTELPKLQMSVIKTEKESRTIHSRRNEYAPVRLSPEKMEEFMREAMEVDKEIHLLKARQQLQLAAQING